MTAVAAELGDVVLRFLVRVAERGGGLGAPESELLLRVAASLGLAGDAARELVAAELARPSDPEALGRRVAGSGHARSVYALGCTLSLDGGQVGGRERALLDGFARGAGLAPEDAAEILAEMAQADEDDGP